MKNYPTYIITVTIMLVKWIDGTTKTFKADWWNAPYKMESEDKEQEDDNT